MIQNVHPGSLGQMSLDPGSGSVALVEWRNLTVPSAGGDEAESLGLYGDTGALDVLLHVPVDKGGFPRRMVPWRRRIIMTLQIEL
jgi:hypothetical protein